MLVPNLSKICFIAQILQPVHRYGGVQVITSLYNTLGCWWVVKDFFWMLLSVFVWLHLQTPTPELLVFCFWIHFWIRVFVGEAPFIKSGNCSSSLFKGRGMNCIMRSKYIMRSPLSNLTTVNGKNKNKRRERTWLEQIKPLRNIRLQHNEAWTWRREKQRYHNSMCALYRALVFTMWMRMGIGSPGRCSPLALGTVTPTLWWTAASERTWQWRRRTIWPVGASFTPHTETRTLEERSIVSSPRKKPQFYSGIIISEFYSSCLDSELILHWKPESDFVKSLNS